MWVVVRYGGGVMLVCGDQTAVQLECLHTSVSLLDGEYSTNQQHPVNCVQGPVTTDKRQQDDQ